MVPLNLQISSIVVLWILSSFHSSICSSHKLVRCNKKDRTTLLTFKQGVTDNFNRLSSWSTQQDCCAWQGVHCHNITGRVTKLDLTPPPGLFKPLAGECNLSLLLGLEFLQFLDLSDNYFHTITTHGNFTASSLHYLETSQYDTTHIDNLQWLSRLSSIKYLDLSSIDLHKETSWLQLVAMLPSLSELHLRSCELNNILPSLNYVNLTSLKTLDLAGNNFHNELPKWLLNLSDISYIDLSYNQLKGSIPKGIGQLEHLQFLDLSDSMFSGIIPSSTLGNLSSLVTLSVGSNSFFGTISETTFSKLSNLEDLYLSNSTFAFHLDPTWSPPFQLRTLDLGNTNQGPHLPEWIYTQKSLQYLDISSSGISLLDWDKFWRIVQDIEFLYLSNNSISGDISNITFNNIILIDLNHNNFTGQLPNILSTNIRKVDLSYNSFSGTMPDNWKSWKDLELINLWSNNLSGELPMDLTSFKKLAVVNLGKNEFFGTIPTNIPQYLQALILRFNHFEGNIPLQIFNLSLLFYLDLAHNRLSGFIPQCIYNITEMVDKDLVTNNGLYVDYKIDVFTKGHDYEINFDLLHRTVDLSVNNLSGEIPSSLYGLILVHTLNLSYNHLTGTIQKEIGGMKELESIDLSNNKLIGEIPTSMAAMSFIDYLNLSCNNLSGQIPTGTQLQSFDASSYIGNPELCGAPLRSCTAKEENGKHIHMDARNEDNRESFYVGMGVGFAVAFWGTCGSLFLVRRWRHTYYRWLDQLWDQLYVTFMVTFNHFFPN
ncbi:hypothetical protein RJT34_00354 [Clitoria ternatea]|uniref:Leucine-rich repeat-containing N-terminal plant-type domain-containing protein n=1 Tax=Clitoria ternatea TaxID=43366 RepID=A0AAN9Q2M7_CLITE